MVLRDSFLQSEKVKIVMLACVCPGSSSADHTLNTLRYAERLKERSGMQIAASSTFTAQQMEDQLKTFKK
jgi:kinesin family protein 2/24